MEKEQLNRERRAGQEHLPNRPRILISADGEIGHWLDAHQTVDELERQASEFGAVGPWQIVGHLGFGSIQLSQDASLEVVSALAGHVETYGPAFGGLAERVGLDALLTGPERFEKSLIGHWDSFEALIVEMADECGLGEAIEAVPEKLRPYVKIDYVSLADDVSTELIVVTERGGVWVFDPWA